jgi:hypothetical protein
MGVSVFYDEIQGLKRSNYGWLCCIVTLCSLSLLVFIHFLQSFFACLVSDFFAMESPTRYAKIQRTAAGLCLLFTVNRKKKKLVWSLRGHDFRLHLGHGCFFGVLTLISTFIRHCEDEVAFLCYGVLVLRFYSCFLEEKE